MAQVISAQIPLRIRLRGKECSQISLRCLRHADTLFFVRTQFPGTPHLRHSRIVLEHAEQGGDTVRQDATRGDLTVSCLGRLVVTGKGRRRGGVVEVVVEVILLVAVIVIGSLQVPSGEGYLPLKGLSVEPAG